MTIAFGFVSAFWLLAVIPVMWLARSGRLVAHVTRHGLLHVVARSVLLAALIAALAQPVLSLTASRIAVVYLVVRMDNNRFASIIINNNRFREFVTID